MRKNRCLYTLFIVILLAISGAAPSLAAEITLRFATINAPGTRSFTDQLEPLKAAIEQNSGGRIKIDLGGLGKFGKPTELLGLLEKGDVEMISSVQGYYPGRFTASTIMELPLLYETSEQGTYALWKLYEEGQLGRDYAGLKVLSLYTLPPYGIFTATVPVKDLRDLRGLRVRAPSLTVGLALGRLGMIPMGLPIDIIGMCLTQNLIDGVGYGWDNAMTSAGDNGAHLIDQVKYLVDARFASPTLMIVMNQAAYDRLPADLRKVIDDATGLDFSLKTAQMRDEWEAVARQTMAQRSDHVVIALTEAQRDEMRRRVAPVVDDLVTSLSRQGVDGAALLERARALLSQAKRS
ncbi:MAG: TRAP transporter substrate-binding protein DctP [Alphaproteobacteria bacterium]|nr:TRAP transporter substrate-binding protein DctP [Alphaproteobacteria bacterium]